LPAQSGNSSTLNKALRSIDKLKFIGYQDEKVSGTTAKSSVV